MLVVTADCICTNSVFDPEVNLRTSPCDRVDPNLKSDTKILKVSSVLPLGKDEDMVEPTLSDPAPGTRSHL